MVSGWFLVGSWLVSGWFGRGGPGDFSPVHERGLRRATRLGENREVSLYTPPIRGVDVFVVGGPDFRTSRGIGLLAFYVAPRIDPANWHRF